MMNYGESLESTRQTAHVLSPDTRPTSPACVSIISTVEGEHSQAATKPSSKHPLDNQDRFFIDDSNRVYGIFDGINGSSFGAETARNHTSEFAQYYPDAASFEYINQLFTYTLAESNRSILSQPRKAGTTAVLACLNVIDDRAALSVAHLGDSRAYLLRKKSLHMLTLDHGMIRYNRDNLQAMKKQEILSDFDDYEDLSEDDLALAGERHRITELLGRDNRLPADIRHVGVQPGDKVLLTTDGIHDNLTTREIYASLRSESSPAIKLVRHALARSKAEHDRAKPDDMTAVVINI